MSGDLLGRLQDALSGTYTLERELGGGGMSRVFVATETALGRKVVVKVLPRRWPPASTSTASAARSSSPPRLQHPHIVPLLAAGARRATCSTSRCRSSTASRSAPASRGMASCRCTRRCASYATSPTRWPTPTAAASFTGTSSRTTSCSRRQHALVTDFGVAKALESRTGEASPDLARAGARHAGLHGARAGGGRAARRSPRRYLRVRRAWRTRCSRAGRRSPG